MELIEQFLGWVLQFLPTSPFKQFVEQLEELPYLRWVNWFLPVGDFIKIGVAWLACIALFYICSTVLRKVGVIK